MNGITLIVFILGKGRGETLARLCAREGIGFHVTLHGRGTAPSEVMSLLGIGDPEKDIVLLSVESSRAEELTDLLSEKLHLDRPGGGIAFSIPFSSAASQFSSLELMAGTQQARTSGRLRGRPNDKGKVNGNV